MAKWQYFTNFVNVDADGEWMNGGGRHPEIREYLQEKYPDHRWKRYDPVFLEAYLNVEAKNRWELLHIEPVYRIGGDRDWQSPYGGDRRDWIRHYFVVLRRQVQDSNE